MTVEAKTALKGIKVLDLTQFLAGPYCSMILGDLGADVIKIEKPTGDPTRETNVTINGQSSYFMSINRGKRSLVLDLKDESNRERLLKMAAQADVFIENFVPGTMDKLGLSYDSVRKVNPRIIYASISGFGQTGPYRERGALDMIIQALSGLMSVTGERNGRPLKVGPSIADMVAGLYATIGILAAINHRNVTGEGQHIDIAMLDAVFSILENSIGNYFATGKIPKPLGNRHGVSAPFQSFETADGEIVIAVSTNRAFEDCCRALNRDDLAKDPRYANRKGRISNVDELAAEITKTTKTLSTANLEKLLESAHVPFATVNTIPQIVADPQIAARNMLQELEHPIAGKVKAVGSPLKMSETPGRIKSCAPLLGQHTTEILEAFGLSSQTSTLTTETDQCGKSERG